MIVCTACHKENNKKDTVYTEEGLPYCNNPFTCNENHPNSPKNILERGTDIPMYTDKELEVVKWENLNLNEHQQAQIKRIITKPMTIRINQVELAYYLLQMKEYYGLDSLSECVRLCVQKVSENFPIKENNTIEGMKSEPEIVEEPKVIKEEPAVIGAPEEDDDSMEF